jgi:rhodanese-related sulfurtransferase
VNTGGHERAVHPVPRRPFLRGWVETPARTPAPLAVCLAIGLLALGCRSIQSDPRRPGLRVRPGVAFEMAVDAPDMLILDLRRPEEFDGPLGHLQRAHNLPLEELPHRLPEIRWLRESTFLVYCRGRTGPQDVAAGDVAAGDAEAGGVAAGDAEAQGEAIGERVAAEAVAAEDVAGGAAAGEAAAGEEAAGEEAAGQEVTGEKAAGDEEADCGEEAIRFFLAQGFNDAVLLDGGIEAWLNDGFATVGRGAQGLDMELPEDSGLRLPEDAKSIGDPRHLPEPP